MNTRCCSRCRAIPGACARKWSCTCHTDDRRDRNDTLTDYEVVAQNAVRKHLNQEARDAAYSRDESKRMSEWSHWR